MAIAHQPRFRAAPAEDCSVTGCVYPVQARGWCHKHYQHWREYGDPIEVKPRPPSVYLTTQDIIDMLAGRVSYRQIDHWIRVGTITAANRSRGSGTYRQFTRAEASAICEFVDELNRTTAHLDRLRSGEVFAELLAAHIEVTP